MNSFRTGDRDAEDGDDPGIGALLREVGARGEPSAPLTEEVRAVVHAEWRGVVERRNHRGRKITYGIAAGIVTALLGVALLSKIHFSPRNPALLNASIVKVRGGETTAQVEISADGNTWRDAEAGEKLIDGAFVRTDAMTSAAIAFENGLSLRVDHGSLLRFSATDRATLQRGRIYVDAPKQGQSPLTVQTRFGAVEHVGTQYQAQLFADKLVVSVREGRIAVGREGAQLRAEAGESMAVDAQGQTERHAVTPDDASWRWATDVAPPFDIDNRSLTSFLDWFARETGKTVRYASPDVRRQAETLILRGSIAALDPEQALKAVLATTPFVHASQATSVEIRL